MNLVEIMCSCLAKVQQETNTLTTLNEIKVWCNKYFPQIKSVEEALEFYQDQMQKRLKAINSAYLFINSGLPYLKEEVLTMSKEQLMKDYNLTDEQVNTIKTLAELTEQNIVGM